MEGNIENVRIGEPCNDSKLLNQVDISRLRQECECLGLDPVGGKRNLIDRLQRSGIFQIYDCIPVSNRIWNTDHSYPNKDSIFIGHEAGINETQKNKLYISNSDTNTPLIKGDFKEEKININNCLKIENSKITHIIDNNGSLQDLYEQVENIMSSL